MACRKIVGTVDHLPFFGDVFACRKTAGTVIFLSLRLVLAWRKIAGAVVFPSFA